MKIYEAYSDADYGKIAKDVVLLSKKADAELYQVLGHALNDMGIDASNDPGVLFKRVDKGPAALSSMKGFNFVARTKPLTKVQAEKKGKGFFRKFGKKIRKEICSNKAIRKIIDGTANLKDHLVVAIPAILAALGGGIVLGPVYLTLISIALAIIIKSGLAAYCEV